MRVNTKFVVIVLDDDTANSLQTKVGEDGGGAYASTDLGFTGNGRQTAENE